jgi:hypothetical protein
LLLPQRRKARLVIALLKRVVASKLELLTCAETRMLFLLATVAQ